MAWPRLNAGVGQHKSMHSESTIWRWVRLLPVVAFVWLLASGLLLLQFWPVIPQSKTQWVLFIAFGPPLWVLGEAVSEWLFSKRRGYSISPSRFSYRRILFGLVVALVVVALVGGASSLLSAR